MDAKALVFGFVIAMLFVALFVIISKIIKNKKTTNDKLSIILEQYKEELIKLIQTVIDLVSIDHTLSDEEFRRKVLQLSTTYFRDFLRRQTVTPEFLILIITEENISTIVDLIIENYKPEVNLVDNVILEGEESLYENHQGQGNELFHSSDITEDKQVDVFKNL